MKLARISLGMAVAVVGLVISACTPAAPAPTPTKAVAAPTKAVEPTKAPSAPTKAAEPTRAPTVVPTAAPATKVVYPTPGKTITIIVPWPAGGIMDVSARVLAPVLSKDLGVPVVVVNKAGASGQVGTSEAVRSKPDGYTICYTALQATVGPYLDPQMKATATYGRKDFEPVVLNDVDPETITVKADSPFKSLKDLVDAAKAKPEQIKAADIGVLSNGHMALSLLTKAAGIKLTLVHFDGGPPVISAVLGGHADVGELGMAVSLPQVRNGALRHLGVYDARPSRFFPSVPTLEQQGYKVYFVQSRGFTVPAGTPREIVDVLASAFKKASENPDVIAKFDEIGLEQRFGGPREFAAAWDEVEKQLEPLLAELAKDRK